MVSPVIDLSHHNPEPDWAALKASGVVAIIHKATQGTGYVDPTYGSRSLKAEGVGLLWAPYHFLEGDKITQQMDWFLDRTDPPQGGRMVIDHEQNATLDDLCDAVTYLWSKRPDLEITIYSGHLIKEQLGTTTVRGALSRTSLWIAQYTSAASPSWPKQQWANWSLWQWTDRETVPGISQPVDGNKWNGSSDGLIRFMSPAGDVPQPEPETPQVIIDINAPEGVSVLLTINGQEYTA